MTLFNYLIYLFKEVRVLYFFFLFSLRFVKYGKEIMHAPGLRNYQYTFDATKNLLLAQGHKFSKKKTTFQHKLHHQQHQPFITSPSTGIDQTAGTRIGNRICIVKGPRSTPQSLFGRLAFLVSILKYSRECRLLSVIVVILLFRSPDWTQGFKTNSKENSKAHQQTIVSERRFALWKGQDRRLSPSLAALHSLIVKRFVLWKSLRIFLK